MMRMLRAALALAVVGGLVAASVGVGLDSGDEARACGEGKLPPQTEYGGVYGVVREIDLDRFARIHRDEIAFARLDVRAVTPGTSQRGWIAFQPGDVFALIDPPGPPRDVYMRAEDAWILETGDCVLVYGPYGVIDCAGVCEPITWFVDGIAGGPVGGQRFGPGRLVRVYPSSAPVPTSRCRPCYHKFRIDH